MAAWPTWRARGWGAQTDSGGGGQGVALLARGCQVEWLRAGGGREAARGVKEVGAAVRRPASRLRPGWGGLSAHSHGQAARPPATGPLPRAQASSSSLGSPQALCGPAWGGVATLRAPARAPPARRRQWTTAPKSTAPRRGGVGGPGWGGVDSGVRGDGARRPSADAWRTAHLPRSAPCCCASSPRRAWSFGAGRL